MFLVLQLRNPNLTQSHKDLSEVFQRCIFTFRSMIELIFAWSEILTQGQFFARVCVCVWGGWGHFHCAQSLTGSNLRGVCLSTNKAEDLEGPPLGV